MIFNPVEDMNAIDGCISDLASKRDRPQGYPFSKITIYSTCPEIEFLMPDICYVPAKDVPSMKKLDFKKAGKNFPDKVKEWKEDLSKVPDEFIITSPVFDKCDLPNKKTTGCRKYLIEVEDGDCKDRYAVIEFRKAVKKYITEDLNIHIVPPIFGDKYPDINLDPVARVWVDIIDCKESLYQSLLQYGKKNFQSCQLD